MTSFARSSITLVAALAVAACGDDASTNPNGDDDAIIDGRVEQTAPTATPSGVSGPARTAAQAQTVAVVSFQGNGSLTTLATADVEADGSFRIEGVPADREDLAVVAYVDGQNAGGVLVHQRTRAGTVTTVAPIDYQTTVAARVYGELKAMGEASASSDSEAAVFVRVNGPHAEAILSSGAELMAVANGFATASTTLDEVYAEVGTTIDSAVRTQLMTDAAVAFASSLNSGTSAEVAHEAFAQAALDAFLTAGATTEANVLATAGAATTFGARLASSSSVRGAVIAQAVRLNLKARERLAADFDGTGQAALSASIRAVLASTRTSLAEVTTAAQIRAALDAEGTALLDVMGAGVVELLVPDAAALIKAEVRVLAELALGTAFLNVRLESATTAEAAAQAIASYRADVRSAVETLVTASGETEADAEALTSLFIAAAGHPEVH
jgi:hypothetical protein